MEHLELSQRATAALGANGPGEMQDTRITNVVHIERERFELSHCPLGEGTGQRLHTSVANLVPLEVEQIELCESPSGKGFGE